MNDVRVILQRHGEYYGLPPGVPEAKELIGEGKLGRLTEQGEETVRKAAKHKISEILKSNEEIEFAIFYSPTTWFGHKDARTGQWINGYGMRAKDSAKIVYDTLLLERQHTKNADVYVINYVPDARLEEANIFFIENAHDPQAYIKALRSEYGENWWEAYFNGAPDLEPLREQVGAESPREISERVENFIKENSTNSGDSVKIAWGLTHGEDITCFWQYAINEGKNIVGKFAEYGEILEVNTSKKTATFKGKEYEI